MSCIWPKMTARLAFEGKSKTVGVAVMNSKTADREFPGIDDPSFRQRNELQGDRGPSLAPEARDHPSDHFERARAAMDPHDFAALLRSQCRKEAGNAEHVIEMAVRQQQPIEPSQAGAAPQQLALSALPAIHQDPAAARFDEKTRMIAFGRWNARRCTEKG